jgi:hypothetical protein
VGSVAALASIGLVSALSSGSAPAQTESNGNVTTCAQIGLAGDTQVAGSGDENIGITADDSSITVSIIGSGVVIDAVVVKGGPNANIYEPGGEGTFSTPTNPANGQPYGLSHYFVCYNLGEVTTTEAPTTTVAAAPTTAGAQVSPATVTAASPATAVAGAARFTG